MLFWGKVTSGHFLHINIFTAFSLYQPFLYIILKNHRVLEKVNVFRLHPQSATPHQILVQNLEPHLVDLASSQLHKMVNLHTRQLCC